MIWFFLDLTLDPNLCMFLSKKLPEFWNWSAAGMLITSVCILCPPRKELERLDWQARHKVKNGSCPSGTSSRSRKKNDCQSHAGAEKKERRRLTERDRRRQKSAWIVWIELSVPEGFVKQHRSLVFLSIRDVIKCIVQFVPSLGGCMDSSIILLLRWVGSAFVLDAHGSVILHINTSTDSSPLRT